MNKYFLNSEKKKLAQIHFVVVEIGYLSKDRTIHSGVRLGRSTSSPVK